MKSYQKLDLLLAVYIMILVAAELMGGKIFSVWGVNASVAIFAFPITFTINDIVAEVYGKARAVSFVRSGLWILVGLFVYSLLATLLPPAARFSDNAAYLTVFQKSQRIIVASLTAFWLSERFDVYIFSRIRKALGQKRLWLRNNASNAVAQLFDTSIFMFLAFFDPSKSDHAWFIISLIIPYWLLKCCASVIQTPFTYLGVQWLRQGAEPSHEVRQ